MKYKDMVLCKQRYHHHHHHQQH